MFRNIFIFALFATCCGYVFADALPRQLRPDPVVCKYNSDCDYECPTSQYPATEYRSAGVYQSTGYMTSGDCYENSAPRTFRSTGYMTPEDCYENAPRAFRSTGYMLPEDCYENTPAQGRGMSDSFYETASEQFPVVTEQDYAAVRTYTPEPAHLAPIWPAPGTDADVQVVNGTPVQGSVEDARVFGKDITTITQGDTMAVASGGTPVVTTRINDDTMRIFSNNDDNVRIVSKVGDDLIVENNVNIDGWYDYPYDFSGGANLTHVRPAPAGFNIYEQRSEMPLMHVEMLEDDGGAVLAMSRPGKKKNAYRNFGRGNRSLVPMTVEGQGSESPDWEFNNYAQGTDTGAGYAESDVYVKVSEFDSNADVQNNWMYPDESVSIRKMEITYDSGYGSQDVRSAGNSRTTKGFEVTEGNKSASRNAHKEKDQVRSWVVASGQTLREVLQDWCDKEGWDLVWATSREYPIQASAVFKGRFMDVASALVRNFSRATPIPYAKFYKGNRVIVVTTDSGE